MVQSVLSFTTLTEVMSMQNVRVRGQRSMSQRSKPNLAVSRLYLSLGLVLTGLKHLVFVWPLYLEAYGQRYVLVPPLHIIMKERDMDYNKKPWAWIMSTDLHKASWNWSTYTVKISVKECTQNYLFSFHLILKIQLQPLNPLKTV